MEMTMSMFIDEFWKKIKESYPGDEFPDSYKEARRHRSGDGLADFIRIEIEEATDGIDDLDEIVHLARNAMERAWFDINDVVKCLEGMELSGWADKFSKKENLNP